VQPSDALAKSASDPLPVGYYDGMQEMEAPPLAPVPPPPFYPVRASRLSHATDQATVLPLASHATTLSSSEQWRLMRQAGRAFVAAMSEREIWRALINSLQEVCHFASCSVLLVDDTGNYELTLIARHPLGQHFLQRNIERLAFEVLRSGLPPVKPLQLAVRQILDAPDEMSISVSPDQPPAEEIESFIAYPLVSKGRMIGLLGLADECWGVFGRDHEEFLAAIVDYAAVALENVRLRQAEQHLWEQVHLEHQRLARIIATMAEGLLIVDEAGAVHTMNPMARTLLSRAGLEIGEDAVPLSGLLGASEDSWLGVLGQVLERAWRRQEIAQAELVARMASDSVPVMLSVSASPYHDADGRLVGAVAVLNDITDRKQIEKWKDEFLSSVSHELRTPLTPIKGYTQHLLRRAERRMAEAASEAIDSHEDRPAAESYEHRCLGIIQSEAEHLERLVNNLLDFSLLQRGTLQLHPLEFDLAELVRQMVQSIQISAEQHRLNLNVWAQDTRVFADRERIRVIIGNVIDNAIKYSPNGGPVTVNLLGDERELVVAVSDKGIGIAPEHFDHLFDRFHHPDTLSSRQYGGIGVSLYLAQAILKLQGGRIWAESNRNQGETGALFAFALSRPKTLAEDGEVKG
jgi:two-component system phosphate regulon sensor histidine kinase PhoR